MERRKASFHSQSCLILTPLQFCVVANSLSRHPNRVAKIYIHFAQNYVNHTRSESPVDSTIQMEVKKKIVTDNGNVFLLESEVLRLSIRSDCIEYKYAVIRGSTTKNEHLESPDTKKATRVLSIGSELTERDFIMKCDGIVRNTPNKRVLGEVAEKCVRVMLPKWRPFSDNEACVPMLASEAIKSLRNVINCLVYVFVTKAGAAAGCRRVLANKSLEEKKLLFRVLRGIVKDGAREDVIAAVGVALVLDSVGSDGFTVADFESLALALSLQSDFQRRVCPPLEEIAKHFPEEKCVILSAVRSVCTTLCKCSSLANWLLAMPIIHFLSDRVKPFEVPSVTVNRSEESWWSLDSIAEAVGSFRKKKNIAQSVLALRDQLKPLIQLDRLLMRVIFFIIDIKDFDDWTDCALPLEILAALAQKKFEPGDIKTVEAVEKILKKVTLLDSKAISNLKTRVSSEAQLKQQTGSNYDIALELLRCLCDCDCDVKSVGNAVCPVLNLLFAGLHHEENTDVMEQVTTKASKAVAEWIESTPSNTCRESPRLCLRTWSRILETSVPNDDLASRWIDTLVQKMKTNLKTNLKAIQGLKRTNVILTFFDLNDEEIHTEVKDAVESIIADDVEPLIEKGVEPALRRLHRTISSKLNFDDFTYQFVLMLFKRSSKAPDQNDSINTDAWLASVLEWPPCQYAYSNSERFDKELSFFIQKTDCIIREVLDNIGGGVTIRQLGLLMKNKETFRCLCECFRQRDSKKDQLVTDGMKNLVDHRFPEFETFEQKRSLVTELLQLCRQLVNVSVEKIERKVEKAGKRFVNELKGTTDTSPLEGVRHCPGMKVIQRYSNMLENLKSSDVFKRLWQKCENEMHPSASFTSWKDFCKFMDSVLECWISFCHNIRDATATLSQIRYCFGSLPNSELEKELKIIQKQLSSVECIDESEFWTKERKEQLIAFRKFSKICEAAKLLEMAIGVLKIERKNELVLLIEDIEKQPLSAINEILTNVQAVLEQKIVFLQQH
ncbi:uncharacterized protein [Oscarella lobularis]|uniref:uncharacterized protein isoform X2 n=1 Tax=Oscarella lobularis TaxID=121494 RepID=UPI00331412DC